MGKKLAIKGHSTRGKEVIELLEMLGGINPFTINDGAIIGNRETRCYYISKDIADKYISWDYIGPEEIDKYEIFTLEEFLEKYPFKVGDMVIDDSGEDGIIIEMKWDEEIKHIKYKVDFGKECYYFASYYLRPFDGKCERTHEDVIFDSIIWHLRNSVNNGKQNLSGGECEEYFREVVKKNNENKMKSVLAELLEHIKTTPKEDLEREFEEIKEWSNVGPTVEEFKAFCECVNKKPKYPETYKECCDVLNLAWNKCFAMFDIDHNGLTDEENNLYESLIKLKRCRDAYWKIAGEVMGLEKPWEPDWSNDDETKFCIYTTQNIISLDIFGADNRILAFPTEEMRDIFYENFKNEIEQCKELL